MSSDIRILVNVPQQDKHGFQSHGQKKISERQGEHVAGLRKNSRVSDGRAVYGVYKGVRVGVIRIHIP